MRRVEVAEESSISNAVDRGAQGGGEQEKAQGTWLRKVG